MKTHNREIDSLSQCQSFDRLFWNHVKALTDLIDWFSCDKNLLHARNYFLSLFQSVSCFFLKLFWVKYPYNYICIFFLHNYVFHTSNILIFSVYYLFFILFYFIISHFQNFVFIYVISLSLLSNITLICNIIT